MVDYLDAVIEQFNILKREVGEQGAPDAGDGEELSKAFAEQLDTAVASFEDGKDKLNDFDPEEGSAQDLDDIFNDLDDAADEQSEALDEFGEITDAFSDECPEEMS